MDRHEDEETLSALLDGALSAGELSRAEAHLSGCPDCRALRADLKRVRDGLRAAARRTMPAGLAADIQRLADSRSVPVWALPRVGARYVVYPTLGFLAAGMFLGLWSWQRSLEAQPQIPIQALIAAHERYRDTGLLAAVDPAQADFPSTLSAYENGADQ